MDRTLAALDIGTNTTLFLLAKVTSIGKIIPLLHDLTTNDLGRGLDTENNLTPETISLNINQLRNFKQIAQEHGAVEIRIAATEALRRARNAQVLIDRVQQELGLTIEVISGEREAYLTYRGILSGLSDPTKQILAVDVGGGSTEIIHGEGEKICFSVSLPIGAVSLDKQFLRSDPPQSSELTNVSSAIERALQTLPLSLSTCDADLIICGGTASALAAADLGLKEYQPEKISSHPLNRERIERFIEQFANCTLAQRRITPGIGYRRAEIILPGTMIIAGLLQKLEREHYITSERGLRYGLLVG